MIVNAKSATLVNYVCYMCEASETSLCQERFCAEQRHIQFEAVKGSIEKLNLDMNLVLQDEHVACTQNRVIHPNRQERVRGIRCMLPFKKFPGYVTVILVASCIFWLNVFPKITGVSATMSPCTIITG